jgi:hypothetical protein
LEVAHGTAVAVEFSAPVNERVYRQGAQDDALFGTWAERKRMKVEDVKPLWIFDFLDTESAQEGRILGVV